MTTAQHPVTELPPASAEQWQRLEVAIAALLAVKPRSEMPGLIANRRREGVLHSERHLQWAIRDVEQATKNGRATNA